MDLQSIKRSLQRRRKNQERKAKMMLKNKKDNPVKVYLKGTKTKNDKHVNNAINKDLKSSENKNDPHRVLVPSTSTNTSVSAITDQNIPEIKPKKKRSKHTVLSLSRVRSIMKRYTPDFVNIGFQAVYAVTKVTELFVQKLALEASKIGKSKKRIVYNDIANTVQENENLKFLSEILPKKITMAEYYQILAQEKKESKDNIDDSQT